MSKQEKENSIVSNLPVLLTVKEVAKIIHTNTSYVYDLIKSQKLAAIKLGSYKIRKEALEQFLIDNEGNDLTNPYNIIRLNDVS